MHPMIFVLIGALILELCMIIKSLIDELHAAREVIEAFRNADTIYPHSCTDSKSCYLCRANDAYDKVKPK